MNTGSDSEKALVYVAAPADGRKGPGVIVIHAFWGLTDVFKNVCDRLAAEGFVAGAPDMFDGKSTTDIDTAFQQVEQVNAERSVEKMRAAVRELQAHPQVSGSGLGVIGFSIGGSWGFSLSRLEPQAVKAMITFYGAGDEGPYDAASAVYQGHFAENDRYEEEVYVRGIEAALRAAGREVTFYTYPNTQHWFFEANRPEFDPAAAQLAWERTLAFLRQHLTE